MVRGLQPSVCAAAIHVSEPGLCLAALTPSCANIVISSSVDTVQGLVEASTNIYDTEPCRTMHRPFSSPE